MANRRQFLAGSVASSALMTSFAARAGTLLKSPSYQRLAAFVFDERVAYGPALAQHLDPHADRTFAIRGDVSELWYDHLAPEIARGARPIGGVTNVGAMFVLARLGHDVGMTLAFHGKHRFPAGDEAGEHALQAPDLVKKQYDAAVTDGMHWIPALQTALIAVASTPSIDREPVLDAIPFQLERQATLHSWLLVPRG